MEEINLTTQKNININQSKNITNSTLTPNTLIKLHTTKILSLNIINKHLKIK